jgi:hypothetical protein
VKIAGITRHPDSRWMTQIARNLTDLNDGFLRGKRYLILASVTALPHHPVQRRQRLGGMLSYYHRAAA